MTKRRYQDAHAMTNVSLQQPAGNSARSDAVSVGISAALYAFCGYVTAWGVVYWIFGISAWTVILSVPFAVFVAMVAIARALWAFTLEHRSYLYRLEDRLGIDIDHDGSIGVPDDYQVTTLRGTDGIFHRVNVTLTDDEKRAVKQHLLMTGKATVRGLSGIVGERASLLRSELIGLGICSRPQRGNAAAMVSDAGRKTLTRW